LAEMISETTTRMSWNGLDVAENTGRELWHLSPQLGQQDRHLWCSGDVLILDSLDADAARCLRWERVFAIQRMNSVSLISPTVHVDEWLTWILVSRVP
jgi:hypothetical protein